MGFPPQDFKSCVSTSSTTSANAGETLKSDGARNQSPWERLLSLEAALPGPHSREGP
jgi:hypothetical protein